MRYLRPTTLAEALELRANHPEAVVVSGGTDVMVAMNFGRLRPSGLLDLSAVPELRLMGIDETHLVVGACVALRDLVDRHSHDVPGLAAAARTVGSPQIRSRATLGGNLGTASPAGDTLPPLVAAGAGVVLASRDRRRTVPVSDFLVGPRRHGAEADELIVEVRIPVATGPQQFSKVGARNAMVISVAGLALELQPAQRRVRCAVGSVAPVVRRATEAENLAAASLPWPSATAEAGRLPTEFLTDFARAVRAAASPIDDVRGTATYRLHALEVLARRCLTWVWSDMRRRATCA